MDRKMCFIQNLLAAKSFWGDVPTWIGVVGTLLGIAIALCQYWRAQAWKRSEFVAGEMSKLFADSHVKTALLLLDYNRIRLNPVDGTRATTENEGKVFDDALCISALRIHDAMETGVAFSREEMLIREAFDALLTQLENLDHFIVTGLVLPRNLRPYLAYWLNILGNPQSARKGKNFYDAMGLFITRYGYSGVTNLLKVVAEIELVAKSASP